MLIQSVNGAALVSLSADPDIVQSVNSKLIINFALSKRVEAGGWIRITFPAEYMTISASTTNCKEDLGLLTITACSVEVDRNYIEFVTQDAIELDGTTSDNYQISAESAINLRDTIAVVEEIYLSTVSGETWAATFAAKRGTLRSATLTPTSPVVGADTSLTVALTTEHRIPKKGKLMVAVYDYWNVGSDNPMDYFSSVTCSDFYIGGVEVTDAYICSFLDGNRVEVDGGFLSAEVPAGTDITVRLLGFRNPIAANMPFEVFSVYTSDEGEENTVDYLEASVTATMPALLTGGTLAVSPLQKENIGVV
jgi:hypothetical protein